MGCSQSSPGTLLGTTTGSLTHNGRSTHLQPEAAAAASALRSSAHKGNSGKLGLSDWRGLSDLDFEDPELEEAATKIQAAYRGHRTRNPLKMAEEEVVDIDLKDPEVASAATKIQASFRGHQARRAEEKAKKIETDLSEDLKKLNTDKDKPADEEELPDLSDPELNKAATMIQAQFRGHMVRKTDEKSEKESK